MRPYPKSKSTMTSRQYREEYFSKTRKKSKMHNVSQVYNGFTYASKLEARYAQDLDWQMRFGDVKSWERQWKLELKVHGKRVCYYYIDFRVVMKDGSIEYVETKGYPTELWKLKWNILLASLGTTDSPIEVGAEIKVVK